MCRSLRALNTVTCDGSSLEIRRIYSTWLIRCQSSPPTHSVSAQGGTATAQNLLANLRSVWLGAGALFEYWAHEASLLQGNRVKKSSGDETCEEFVVPSGGLASEAYAVLAGGSADQVVSHVFDGGEIGRRMVGAQPAFVVAENHIHNPV
jgi:hypothetical protein